MLTNYSQNIIILVKNRKDDGFVINLDFRFFQSAVSNLVLLSPDLRLPASGRQAHLTGSPSLFFLIILCVYLSRAQ